MKKLLSILLALLLPTLAVAEGAADLGIIGGADGPTSVIVSDSVKLPGPMGEAALAAGRRVTSTMKITEFSGVALDTADETKAMTDLLNAMSLVTAEQGDEADVTLRLNGEAVLDLGVALSGKDAYISSDLLGGTIVVNVDEAEGLFSRVLDMLVRMGAMTQSEANTMRSQIMMMKEIFAEAQAASGESIDLQAELNKLDYTALEKINVLAESKMVVLNELVVPRMCDAAATGVQAKFSNEDMVEVMLCLCQFVLDNPSLKNYLGEQLGFPTEEEIAQMWQTNGAFYKLLGLYESEEAFRAAQQTIDSYMAALMEEIPEQKAIEGEYVITIYGDEEGQPVYVTAQLPLFIEEETLAETADAPQQTGHVMPINLTYTRQTVAAGVSHVCNIDIDGAVLSTDLLVGENESVFALYVTEADEEPIKFMDVSVKNVEDTLAVEANIYDGPDQKVLSLLLDGVWEFTDVRSYLSGKLTMTVYEEYEGVMTESALTLEVSTDTAINGIDFSGVSKIAMEVGGIRIGLQSEFATSDPEESIMVGQVVRPAELDDSAFTKWFIKVLKSVNIWQANALNALPESTMEIVLFSENK